MLRVESAPFAVERDFQSVARVVFWHMAEGTSGKTSDSLYAYKNLCEPKTCACSTQHLDTKELAKAAKAQADAAKSTADSAKSQADNTSKLAQAAVDQVGKLETLASATKDSAHAAQTAAVAMGKQVDKLQAGVEQTALLATRAKDANEQSARALAIQTRPWIKIEIEDIKLTPVKAEGSPPSYSTKIKYSLHNYGSSPALDVYAEFDWGSDLARSAHFPNARLCERTQSSAAPAYIVKDTIFPGQPSMPEAYLPGIRDVLENANIDGCVVYRGIGGTVLYHTLIHFYFQATASQDGTITARDRTINFMDVE